MGALLPATLALALNFNGILIFRDVKEAGPGPLLSSYIFMATMFVLLCGLPIFPKTFRRVWRGEFFVEFLACQFIMEFCVTEFWFPLETNAIQSLPKLADFLAELFKEAQWNSQQLDDFLRSESTGVLVSYIMSVFLLLSALHCTRVIDLRELQFGPRVFIGDVLCRAQKFYKKKMRKLVGSGKKRVLFEEDDILKCLDSDNNLVDFSNYYMPHTPNEVDLRPFNSRILK